MSSTPLDGIKKSDLALFEQIGQARELAFSDGDLSKKHKLLIALAIDVVEHSERGIRSLAMQALEAGASKAEIMETLRVVNYICGAGSMYAAANALQDIL